MQRHNATVSPLILDAIDELVQEESFLQKRLAQAVKVLSRLFTEERSNLSRTYLDDGLLGTAYLQYFLPVNLAKIQVLLVEMPAPQMNERFSVLDLGSGPGTGALAVLDWWQQRAMPHALSVTAVDASTVALQQAQQLWDRYCQAAGVGKAILRTSRGDLGRRGGLDQVRTKGPFDLILVANCLNEIHANEIDAIESRTGFVREWLSLLTRHGTMMIVEPALRETARGLHQLRDRLLQEQCCTVYSPCLHENPCPALVNPHDWCHEERTWEPPASIQAVDKKVGFIKDALKFSYLLLRKDGKTIVERRSAVYRVVSELRVMKGEKRAWVCNEQGRQEVGRQDRLASPQNAAFDEWHRGAIIQVEQIVHKERGGKGSALGRIVHDSAVEIIRRA
jgi:ribosomal protein RSM22 (predicted rRNA methylase)